MDLLKENLKENFKYIIKTSEIALNIIVILVSVTLLSFMYFYSINKNKSIVPFYIGIIISILIGSKVGKLFKSVNNNSEYKDIYNKVIDDPLITNFSSVFKNIFSKINIFSKTISKKEVTENNLIMPNIFCMVIIFCYLYLVLCFSSSFSLNNDKESPKILKFFNHIIPAYFVLYSIYCTLKLFELKKNNVLKIKHFDFILNVGIYNLITSTIISILIAFIYFNVIKTFFKKNLFFQNTKFCKKTEDNDELCYYEPIKSNWGYSYS